MNHLSDYLLEPPNEYEVTITKTYKLTLSAANKAEALEKARDCDLCYLDLDSTDYEVE